MSASATQGGHDKHQTHALDYASNAVDSAGKYMFDASVPTDYANLPNFIRISLFVY